MIYLVFLGLEPFFYNLLIELKTVCIMWSVICILYFLLNLNILSGITRPSEKRWYSGQHFILNLLIGIYKRLSMINLQIFCKIIFSPVCWCFFLNCDRVTLAVVNDFSFPRNTIATFFPALEHTVTVDLCQVI